MKFFKTYLLLAIIVIAAAILRFTYLDKFPSGTTFDEAVIGINAYTIGYGLRDEFGKFLPDLIKVDEDYRNIVLIYITAPIVKLFGLNEYSVRASTAIFGVLLVFLSFILSKIIIKDNKIAMVTAFLVAISPWLINLSRSGSEGVLALSLLILADIFMFYGIRKNKISYHILAFIFYVLMWFSYIGAVPIALIHLLYFTLFSLKKYKFNYKNFVLLTFIAFIIFPNLYYYVFQTNKITARMNNTSVFTDKNVQLLLDEQIREEKGTGSISVLVTRFFHSKPINYGFTFIHNYSQYFSQEFLFGNKIEPTRYYIPNFALIFYIDIIFIFLGIFAIFRKITMEKGFILLWLISGPISSSLTVAETPNIHRAIFMLPAWQIITAIGIIYALEQIKSKKFHVSGIYKIFGVAILIIYLFFLSYSVHQLFVHQPAHRNWYRNDEWKNAVYNIVNLENKYEKIVLTKGTTEPYYYLMFFSPTFRNSHNNVNEYLTNRNLKNSWNLGKYSFSTLECPLKTKIDADINTLYVNGQNCPIPVWSRIINEIKTSDGVVKLTLLDVPFEVKNKQQLFDLEND